MRRSIHTPLRSASTPRFSRSFVGRTTNPNAIIRPTVLSRTLLTSTSTSTTTSSAWKASTLFTGLALATGLTATVIFSDESKVDYDKIRQEIKDILVNENYDDGSYGPVLVRLAWHASGTYSRTEKNGGSNGATMRYKSEASDGANAGLDVARNLLEKIKKKYPGISYADLWTLAGSVAIEEMGGPKIDWVPGRTDADSEKACPPQGRLPDAAQGASHVRDVFYRMGFNDREITALIGAHALGRCHPDRSGFDGPWTSAPTAFTNEFYIQLMENKWTVKDWKGPKQYEDSSKTLMMLPADMAFLWDEEFKKYVKLYADDEDLWFEDFAKAWKKLIELGTPMESKSWWQKIFG